MKVTTLLSVLLLATISWASQKRGPPKFNHPSCSLLISPYAKINYQYSCTKGRLVGSVCTLRCPGVGLILHGGVSRVVCLKNKKWSHSLDQTTCVKPLQCPDLIKENPDLLIKCSRGNYIWSRCQVACPDDKTLIGISRVYCRADGRWSSNLKRNKCVEAKRCPDLNAAYSHLQFRCTHSNNIRSRCSVTCPTGQKLVGASRIYCTSNGDWTPSLEKTKCVRDDRCPLVRPGPNCQPTACPSRCPNGQVCCQTGCGTACFSVPAARCPAPFRSRERRSFSLKCSDSFNVDSVCHVVCRYNTELRGVSQIQCLSSGKWDNELDATQCIPAIVCPPGSPQVRCNPEPCKIARCPGVPDAACVNNFCGGCNFEFYVKGRKIDDRRCIDRKPCQPRLFNQKSRSYRICQNVCETAVCPINPDAICEPDCNCAAIFYDPFTFEQVKCKPTSTTTKSVPETNPTASTTLPAIPDTTSTTSSTFPETTTSKTILSISSTTPTTTSVTPSGTPKSSYYK